MLNILREITITPDEIINEMRKSSNKLLQLHLRNNTFQVDFESILKTKKKLIFMQNQLKINRFNFLV